MTVADNFIRGLKYGSWFFGTSLVSLLIVATKSEVISRSGQGDLFDFLVFGMGLIGVGIVVLSVLWPLFTSSSSMASLKYVEVQADKLLKLKEQGVLSESEYQEKIAALKTKLM